MQQAALGRSCGSEQAAASLVRYCSLDPADFARIRRRVCLVMETAPSVKQISLWLFFQLASPLEARNCICGREGIWLNNQNVPPSSSVFPPNLFSESFWNFSLKTETFKGSLRPESSFSGLSTSRIGSREAGT